MKNKTFIIALSCCVIVSILYEMIQIFTPKIYITEIEELNSKEIFDNITVFEVGKEDYSYSSVFEDDIHYNINLIKELIVNEKPIQKVTTRERDKSNYIALLNKKNSYYKFYFNKNNSQVWIDYGYGTTYTYKVRNKKILNALFEPLNPYFNKKLDLKHIDGRIEELKENEIILHTDQYKEYSVTFTNPHDSFVQGEKIRILYSELEDSKIKNVNNIYYLNELLVIKDYGKSEYYTETKIANAIELLLKQITINRCDYSLLKLYYDEDRSHEWLDDRRYGKWQKVENTILILSEIVPSRSVDGQLKKINENWDSKNKPVIWAMYDARNILNK